MSVNTGWLFVKIKNSFQINPLKLSEGEESFGPEYYCFVNLLDKFQMDHIFADSHDMLLINDGVILNSHKLYGKGELNKYISERINSNYFVKFRGPFSGLYYNKNKGEILSYTNQTGEKSVYYFEDDNLFIVSSSVWLMKLFLIKTK